MCIRTYIYTYTREHEGVHGGRSFDLARSHQGCLPTICRIPHSCTYIDVYLYICIHVNIYGYSVEGIYIHTYIQEQTCMRKHGSTRACMVDAVLTSREALFPYLIFLISPVHTLIYANIHIHIYTHNVYICVVHIYAYINIYTYTGKHKGVYSRRHFDLTWSHHGHFSRFYLR